MMTNVLKIVRSIKCANMFIVPSSIVQLRLLFPTFFIDGVIKRLKAMIEIMIHSYTHFQGVSASLDGCSAYCRTFSRLKPCYIHVSSPPFGRWIASVSSFIWQEHKRQADIFSFLYAPPEWLSCFFSAIRQNEIFSWFLDSNWKF